VIDHVVDASVLLEVTAGNPVPELRRRVLVGQAAAPTLIEVEVLSALRRAALRGTITAEAADVVAARLPHMPLARMPQRPLMPRIWELRGAVTAYDAAYVALAERLDVPLLTCDTRLAGANGHGAEILAFPVR
jgi:predicted nucleic acid-binding protein